MQHNGDAIMQNNTVKHDLTETMRFAIKRAYEMKNRGINAFVASQLECMEPTLNCLHNYGFMRRIGGIKYELTNEGLGYARLNFVKNCLSLGLQNS